MNKFNSVEEGGQILKCCAANKHTTIATCSVFVMSTIAVISKHTKKKWFRNKTAQHCNHTK